MKNIIVYCLLAIIVLFSACMDPLAGENRPVEVEDSDILESEFENLGPRLLEGLSQDWLSTSGLNPRFNTHFKSSRNIRWYYAGCMTLIGVNTATKEILLVDGYVSKSASGLVDFDMYGIGLGKIKKYVNYLKRWINNGYKIKGMLVTHGHADHMGDVPVIMHLLRQAYGKSYSFPIITDYYTYQKHNKCNNLSVSFSDYKSIVPFKNLVTDIIVYGNVSLNTTRQVLSNPGTYYSSISSFGKGFTDTFKIYNIASKNYTATNVFKVGSFNVNAYLMDHAYVPGVDKNYRVNAFKISGNGIDNTAVMILDTTDNANFVTKTIKTDHLFLTWHPTFFRDTPDSAMGHNRERTALTFKKRIRFNSPGTHYVIPLHVDDIAAGSYETENVCNSRMWKNGGMNYLVGFLKWKYYAHYEPRYPYSITSVMLSDAALRRRNLGYGKLVRFYNPNPPRIDAIEDVSPSSVGALSSPLDYYFKTQNSEERRNNHKLRFVTIQNRAGDEY